MRMEKIKVLMLSGAMDVGGIENQLMHLLRNANREKFQVDFTMMKHCDESEMLGGLRSRVPAKQRRQEIRRICKLYRAEKVRPVGWKCRGIALPIQLSWAFMLDMLVRYKAG